MDTLRSMHGGFSNDDNFGPLNRGGHLEESTETCQQCWMQVEVEGRQHCVPRLEPDTNGLERSI